MWLSASIRDVMSWIRGARLAQGRGKGRMGVIGRNYSDSGWRGQQLRGEDRPEGEGWCEEVRAEAGDEEWRVDDSGETLHYRLKSNSGASDERKGWNYSGAHGCSVFRMQLHWSVTERKGIWQRVLWSIFLLLWCIKKPNFKPSKKILPLWHLLKETDRQTVAAQMFPSTLVYSWTWKQNLTKQYHLKAKLFKCLYFDR